MEQIANKIVKEFESKMQEAVENLEAAEMVFDDLNALLEGQEGFDLSKGTWRRSGWRELENLRRVLEKCPELRVLVRQLGRGGGKGPLRRAPEELEQKNAPPGVIRWVRDTGGAALRFAAAPSSAPRVLLACDCAHTLGAERCCHAASPGALADTPPDAPLLPPHVIAGRHCGLRRCAA